MLKVKHAHGGQAEAYGVVKAVHGDIFDLDILLVARSPAAEFGIVGVENDLIRAALRNAYAVVVALNGTEVAYNNNFVAAFVHSTKGDNRLLIVVVGDPREALPREVDFPQGRVFEIEVIERAGKVLSLFVHIVFKKHPVKRRLEVPLLELAELAAHKEQLFAGMRHHISEEGAKSRKFLLIFARHFVNERALAVHNLIVRDRQDKVFGKGVEERECKRIVII